MRRMKIGTIALRKPVPGRPVRNMQERFDEARIFLDEAAREKCDFVCLPEIFASHGIEKSFSDLAEKVPEGPVSRFCSDFARKHGFHIVTSILNRKERGIFNTAVIFGRKGELLAEYDKVHPAPDESTESGSSFPIFEIEGWKIGLQICFDLNFPEGCRDLAVQGADLIFWPTMWDGPTAHFIDCIVRTRAMENFLFIVSSGYMEYGDGAWQTNTIRSLSPTGIVSWNGLYLAQTGLRPGLALATIDADEPRQLQTDRDTHFKLRRPELYQNHPK